MSVQPSKKPRIFDDISNISYIPHKQLIRQVKAPHSAKANPNPNKLHQALLDPNPRNMQYSNTDDISPIKKLKDFFPLNKKNFKTHSQFQT